MICPLSNGTKIGPFTAGVKTRRVLLKYKHDVSCGPGEPLFQKGNGERLSPLGLRSLLVRLTEKTGVKISSHALRRTFVVMALKGGMSIAHVQAIMGHTSPIMTLEYARLVDEDLLSAHKEHGPVDNFLNG